MRGSANFVTALGAYPERRANAQGRHAPRPGAGHRPGALARVLRAVAAREQTGGADQRPGTARLVRIATDLRAATTRFAGMIAALAMTRDLVHRHLGFRPHDEQIAGAWHMLCGRLVEMDTGEGKTVTAVLAAAVHALAGSNVHVITVNDYLAERDATLMAPVYRDLGLTVGCVLQGMDEGARRAAYRCAIVHVTPKQVMFDYLRDRIRLGAASRSPLQTELCVLRSGGQAGGGQAGGGKASGAGEFYLPGLQVAIIDEADSVLVDEAVVPLIISDQNSAPEQGRIAADAIALAGQLREGPDFRVAPSGRDLWLTDAGRARLAHLALPLDGFFTAKLWREQYCEQALTALHLFRRDRDYILRGGAIEIVDVNTGRTMADRSWERGLHQMIQAKEGIAITAPNESLARISHQAFFQRYLNLCGMSGTLREVAREIRQVYGLRTCRVAPHHPSRRRCTGVAIARDLAGKDARVIARASALSAAGRAVLIGTRTVADSERLSARLTAAGVVHRVLNARHDAAEAGIIAEAGRAGAVTVATNMAGRGTDIRPDASVKAKGGLHVIATERHSSRRIDRQLFGRTARQGDPGSYEEVLSLQDAVVTETLPGPVVALARLPLGMAGVLMRTAQARASRAGRVLRLTLARYEEHMDRALAFAGRGGAV